MGIAQLGNYTFRLDPNQIHYAYQIDYTTIDTLGGQVVQVLGSTIGDITIAGQFGQDHKNKRESWQMAESFHATIRAMMDQQVVPPKKPSDPIHQPIRFTYHDGVHNWDMKVLIKGISDLNGTGSIEHSNGKYSYGYTLTLFLVEDSSLLLSKINTDKFIARVANGVGWKRNKFNGSQSLQQAIDFIQKHSDDGTFQGYLAALLEGGQTTTSNSGDHPGGR
jgi:hypothetical protein